MSQDDRLPRRYRACLDMLAVLVARPWEVTLRIIFGTVFFAKTLFWITCCTSAFKCILYAPYLKMRAIDCATIGLWLSWLVYRLKRLSTLRCVERIESSRASGGRTGGQMRDRSRSKQSHQQHTPGLFPHSTLFFLSFLPHALDICKDPGTSLTDRL